MEYIEQIIASYGYIGIVLILTGGIIGLPIPDEMILTFIGYYIYKEKMTYLYAFIAAFLGSTLGISVSYYLGAKLGLPFLEKYGPKMHISRKKIAKSQYLFHKYGPVLLCVGFFLPGVRHITGYLSGIAQYRFLKFAIFAYSGAFFWVLTFISIGEALGHRWVIIETYVARYSLYLFSIFIILLLYLLFKSRWRKNKKNKGA